MKKKNGRISTMEIAGRVGALLLTLVVMIGLLPLTAFADPAETGEFTSMIDPGMPKNYSDDMANPYGYDKGQKFLLNEETELLLYYSFGSNNNTKPENTETKWFDSFQPFIKDSNTDLRKNNASSFKTEGSYDGGGINTQAFGYVAAVGFDPNGTGRKDHVAYVGYENGQQTIDGTNNYKGYVLWVQDTRSGNQYGPWKVSIGSSNWLSSNNADLYAGSNFFNIIAGDFDADGKEDLVISVVDDNQFGLSQYRFSANGGLQEIMKGNTDLLHPEYRGIGSQGSEAKQKLSMDFAVGDFNGDGVDDFAVMSYLNRGSSLNGSNNGNINFGLPYLCVSYGSSGSGSIAAGQRASTYITTDIVGYAANASMYCATVAAGDIDNDGKDELITAGYKGRSQYYNGKLDFGTNENKILYASFYASGGSMTAIEYKELEMNAWTKEGNGREDPVGPKLMVEAVAANGEANPEAIFISGDMYLCERSSNKLDTSGAESPYTLDYFRSADKDAPGGAVGKSYIASVAVGDFMGEYSTKEGREHIAYVVGLQRSSGGHKYSFSVHMAGATVEGADDGFYNVTGDYIFYDQSFNLKDRPNCVIAAIDRDNDGTLASYTGSAYAWSDPQVRAILQASPYFAELNDGASGAEYLYDSPETSYSISETYTYSTSSSDSVSFGFGFKGEIEGGAVSAELQLGAAFDWTKTFTESLQTEVTDTFSAGAYDTVVLCRTPVFLYNYDVTYLDEAGEEVKGTMQIAVPKAPTYEQLTIEKYNEFVAYYNSILDESGADADARLQTVADDLYLGNEGNPFGYYREDASGELKSLERYGNVMKNLTTSAGSNSVDFTISKEKGEEVEIAHGFSFELSVVGGFGIGGASAKAGGYVSLDYMNGHSVSKSHGSGTSFSGTVMGLDGNAMRADGLDPAAWAFNWMLGTWDSNLKDSTENSKGYVPVVGYILNSVKAPPMPVEDLNVQFTRSSETDELLFDLSWACGDVDGTGRTKTAGYLVYLYDLAEDTYKLVGSVDDPETTAYRYQNTFDGREYYHFMVTAYSAPTATAASLESVPRTTTYYMSTAKSTILSIEKSGADGLNDIYTIHFADGTSQTFTVTNGNGIASIELLSADPATGVDTYQITFSDGSTTTFTVTNGEKGEQGEPGKDGVGVDRIEKLRSEGSTDIYAVYLTDGTFYTFSVTNGKDGANGKDGLDGKDGIDGKDGLNGKDGTDGRNGADGTDGATGAGGQNGTDGVGIADIRIDEEGNFIFTLSDGRQINAGTVPADSQQASQLAQAQADIVQLQQQIQKQASYRTAAICGVALAGASLLWQIIALILALTHAKKKDPETSAVS